MLIVVQPSDMFSHLASSAFQSLPTNIKIPHTDEKIDLVTMEQINSQDILTYRYKNTLTIVQISLHAK